MGCDHAREEAVHFGGNASNRFGVAAAAAAADGDDDGDIADGDATLSVTALVLSSCGTAGGGMGI
jgi:hypothetical protein